MKTVPTTELRAHFRAIVTEVQRGERVMIIRNSKPAAVIVPMEDFERLEKLSKAKP